MIIIFIWQRGENVNEWAEFEYRKIATGINKLFSFVQTENHTQKPYCYFISEGYGASCFVFLTSKKKKQRLLKFVNLGNQDRQDR
ncbi:hypothetical protein [Pectobacterium actinidiae]|uniref:hypothetical protein n=2 Tax=Pectobacterium actinidiae TaxID=1507808 RepID=UPI0005731749|nr:hypothetical protein [Pectobacterium actinidiae]KHN92695.1 hypothetical protein KKH3_27220 [Pectobacterium actinidiae]